MHSLYGMGNRVVWGSAFVTDNILGVLGMTRLEGIVFMLVFFVLAVITGNMADNSVGWLDWLAYVAIAVGCTAYCLYYMVRVFDMKPRL